MKKASWIIFGFLSILIGLYPFLYFFVDTRFALLSQKTEQLLNDTIWNIAFYGHIVFGGFALLIGWLQFSKKLRVNNISMHRRIGKAYVCFVLVSGICSLYIALFATGGLISSIGFGSLGVIWLAVTMLGFKAVKKGNIALHQKLMIYSYAACFGAVTLRIWLPILIGIFGEFTPAYRLVAWLSWVPNLLVAYFITNKMLPTVQVSA